MSVDVDDLFRGGAPASPPVDPVRGIARLAMVGAAGHTAALLAGAGMVALSVASGMTADASLAGAVGWIELACLVVYLLLVPSVLVSLYAWHRAGEELDRVRAGALPLAYGPGLRALRRRLFGWLSLAGFGMMVQTALLGWLMAGRGGP